jgi:hypothetical protein
MFLEFDAPPERNPTLWETMFGFDRLQPTWSDLIKDMQRQAEIARKLHEQRWAARVALIDDVGSQVKG